MRFSNSAAIAALAASSVSAVSICDKYTTALLKNNTAANQYAVVSLLVKTVALGNFTGPGTANPTLPGSIIAVPGILAKTTYMGEAVNLLPYFDGTLASSNRGGMPVSINFLDGGSPTNPLAFANSTSTNQYTLISHLVSYFGVLLGCTGYGMDGFPSYGGVNSQYTVHQYMDLSEAEFGYFVSQVGASAESFGVTMDDITAAATALNSTFGYRCAPAAAVVPDTTAYSQVICGGSDCPLSPNSTCGDSSQAAVSGFTETMPATATAPYMTPSGTASTVSGTGAVTSSIAPFSSANAAPRQTAAAGFVAAAGLAAYFL